MTAYYNEIDPYAAEWLRNLIRGGHIADGIVDERSITDVRSEDLKGFTQCHFFAGIGGWSIALRLAGWADDRPVWTGSCPCQPFSCSGKKERQSDERHLWPYWGRLIAESSPSTIFGEQVDDAIADGWLDDVFNDLEKQAYTCASAVLPACGVGAPFPRGRLWFVAHTDTDSLRWERGGKIKARTWSEQQFKGLVQNKLQSDLSTSRGGGLVDGVRFRSSKLRAYGNAIVPQVAAEFIKAYMDI